MDGANETKMTNMKLKKEEVTRYLYSVPFAVIEKNEPCKFFSSYSLHVIASRPISKIIKVNHFSDLNTNLHKVAAEFDPLPHFQPLISFLNSMTAKGIYYNLKLTIAKTSLNFKIKAYNKLKQR